VRVRLGALMMTLLLLAGCGGGGVDEAEQMALEIRAEYLSMTGCMADVAVTADYGDRIFECKLELDHTAGKESVLTVEEPELFKGVTARLREGEVLLEFDGLCLETGPLTGEGISPLQAVPVLLEQVREGFISQWGMETLGENECVFFTTSDPNRQPGEGTCFTVWFEREDFAWRKGEITVDGRSVLRCEISDFIWKQKED